MSAIVTVGRVVGKLTSSFAPSGSELGSACGGVDQYTPVHYWLPRGRASRREPVVAGRVSSCILALEIGAGIVRSKEKHQWL